MKKMKYLLLCILALSFTACEDWFDISPKADVKAADLFEKEAGFRDVLAGVYSLMGTSESYGRQLTFGYVDVLVQYYDQITHNDHEYIDVKDYKYDKNYSKSTLKGIWGNQYKAIVNLNAMLMFIDEKREVFSSDAVYRIYKGEMLALRAMLHFDMLRLFAPSPAMGTELKAIPYVEDYTNIAQSQETVQGTLDKIIRDLNDARDLMREVDSYGPNHATLQEEQEEHPLLRNRVKHLNYYATTALLARVQLYAGNKDAALLAAKEIIGEPADLPVAPFSFTSIPVTGQDFIFSSEQLFSLEKKDIATSIDSYFGEAALDEGVTSSKKVLGISSDRKQDLFIQQNSRDNDIRQQSWFQETDLPTVVIPAKYAASTLREIPMLHLSELYYIASECSDDRGLEYLNQLRNNRGLESLVVAPDLDLQAEIEKEYKKEFLCEGQMFYYYKRLNKSSIGVFKTVDVNPDAVFILPLPDSELDFGLIE